jgi:hypothetical protein
MELNIMPETSDSGCQCVGFGSENSRTELHTLYMYKVQDSHIHHRSDALLQHLVAPQVLSSMKAHLVAMTPD